MIFNKIYFYKSISHVFIDMDKNVMLFSHCYATYEDGMIIVNSSIRVMLLY